MPSVIECPTCGATLFVLRKSKGRCECIACGRRFNARRPFRVVPTAEVVQLAEPIGARAYRRRDQGALRT